jgi:hypothetical protein
MHAAFLDVLHAKKKLNGTPRLIACVLERLENLATFARIK